MQFTEWRSDLKAKVILKKRKRLTFLWKHFLCLLETTVQWQQQGAYTSLCWFFWLCWMRKTVAQRHNGLCPSVFLQLTYSNNPHAQEQSPSRREQMPLHAQWEVGRRSMFCIQRVCVGLNTVHTPQQSPSGRKPAFWNPRQERTMVQRVLFFRFPFSLLKKRKSPFSLWGPEDELLARIYVLSKLAHCG